MGVQNNYTNINKSTNIRQVEQEIRNSTQNINVDLGKLDMTGAIESFERLEQVANAANFDAFIGKITALKDVFDSFQKKVSSTTGSVTKFANESDKKLDELGGTAQNMQINNTIDCNGIAESFGDMANSIGNAAGQIGDSFAKIGRAAIDVGTGISTAVNSISGLVQSISGLIDSAANLFNSFAAFGNGLLLAANGVAMLIPLLPELGLSMLQMAMNLSGITAYIPELIIFLGVLFVLLLMGEGLMFVGEAMSGIGLGLTSMTEGMEALIEFMPLFIASLSGITDNIGGIILFVLLAAAVFLMALAFKMMNGEMTVFVDSLTELVSLMNIGFVAAFIAFGIMLIVMSKFMTKVATGMTKITAAMKKQAKVLAVLNPLLAAMAILSNPFMGVVTVALAIAGGLLVKSLLPAMATGGVVSAPTVALVGEGRYPEAVVPLGSSPQFASMKADIANAVLQGMSALGGVQSGGGGGNKNLTVQLHIDGRQFAQTVVSDFVDTLNNEGYSVLRADAVYR